MQVKKIKIKNYKKLINIDLCLEKDITLIAGPNNAGKTSIVEFLKFLFGDTKDKIELTELNTKLLDDWIEKFYVSYKSVLNKNLNDSKLVDELTSYFMINPINDIQILPEAYIEISYNKKDDQLSDIIRYSFELEEYNSIYFKYLCKLNDNKFKSFLIENGVSMAAITDHNAFDIDMYNKFKFFEGDKLNKVLPGIEFDVEF